MEASQISNLRLFSDLEFLSPGLVAIRLARRVPVFLLSNMSWSKNKSWILHLGEGHTKGWDQLTKFDLPKLTKTELFLNPRILADTIKFGANYLLICGSNDLAP